MIKFNKQIAVQPYQKPRATAPGVLRLQSNEGSIPPRDLINALNNDYLSLLREYPDDQSLRNSVALHTNLQPEQVIITAGADDAIDRCCRAFLGPGRELILPVPEFEMQRRYAELSGAKIINVDWLNEFPLDEVIRQINADTGAIFITSPNNPTGLTVGSIELSTLISAAKDTVIVLDHVYAEYADEDLTRMASDTDNLVVIRTFSKARGLAGCRVGYAIAAEPIARILESAGSPYPVSAISLALAQSRLLVADPTYQQHIDGVRRNRAELRMWLEDRGLESPPSQGNFLFVDFGEQADSVQQRMASKDVLVRSFIHRESIKNYLRISVPSEAADFQRLLNVLESVFIEESI